MAPNFETFNNLIVQAREKKNLSIQELAIKADLSAGKMQDIENLCCIPNRPTLERIASILDIPFSKLWTALGH